MQWHIEDRTVQSSGACLQSIVDSFGALKRTVSQLFIEAGVGELSADGVVQIDPRAWYPIEIEVGVLRAMYDRVGKQTLFTVGTRIPEHVALPPTVEDIESALFAIDVGYHLNHGRNGEPLFDPASGEMGEGIGHFVCEINDEREATIEAPGPFPCELSRGVVLGFARKFESTASIALDPARPSLADGAATSTYIVRW